MLKTAPTIDSGIGSKDPLFRLAYQIMSEYRGSRRMGVSIDVALAWILAGRLATKDEALKKSPARLAHALESEDFWKQWLTSGQLPEHIYKLIWEGPGTESDAHFSIVRSAASRVAEHVEKSNSCSGDVLPLLWNLSVELGPKSDAGQAVHQDVLYIMLQLSDIQHGECVLCTEDYSGQFAASAGRLAGHVLLIGANRLITNRAEVLRALDAADGTNWSFSTLAELDELPETRKLIGLVPFGRPIKPETTKAFSGFDNSVEFNGAQPAEALAMRYYASLSGGIATLLAPPVCAFGRGRVEEVRREILKSQLFQSVTTLPGNTLSGASLSPVLLNLSTSDNRKVVLVDLEESKHINRGARRRYSILEPNHVIRVIRGLDESEDAIEVQVDAILAQDAALLPRRYMMEVDIGESIALGDLVQVIRAPVKSKKADTLTVQEIGIPQLSFDRWQSITGSSKTVDIPERRLERFVLQPGDLVISNKGTIGKSGIVGEECEKNDAPPVLSNSCIALRISKESDQHLLPALLLFLRSESGRKQFDALSTGVAIKQITPDTLLKGFRVPAFTAEQANKSRQVLEEIRIKENEIDSLRNEISLMAEQGLAKSN